MDFVAPKTVLFDLDGTLADTVPLIVATFRRTVSEELGWEPTFEQCKEWIGRSLTETFTDLAPGRADELISHYLEWNLANHHAYVRAFDGVADLVGALRASDRVFGVVTSKRRNSALLSLECVGLTGLVPLLATEEDTASHKPSPEPLLHALRQGGPTPGTPSTSAMPWSTCRPPRRRVCAASPSPGAPRAPRTSTPSAPPRSSTASPSCTPCSASSAPDAGPDRLTPSRPSLTTST